ncbi:pyrroloquinoline quinone biosynthesis protein PqqE [Sulfitobacter sp. M57]|uniref:pyrroloquinoline quinone biosynthesis protein PqqE n=1 Tax=unclassified Sulfitobacter TaxID=196795 RepID=UPI0023E1F788|nr:MULTISPECIES: pyrroloquinoline quinone biosynthesis protein PqqE [unclassified Sulfitobacter]MDF3416537.1 pyrroloquinoline quinone biosynthesis protein PqqE [Sulfitobacter sp. KE5]MDF3424023.1 pyrroloquinoline quinone biosynthesis protein PqqE [Sulfitobacter sp. KE43]MDF3435009.1 pyrroloquinoline quinone biosynthesis protein PqqE [Sulfitobacter sp. KE42]MDF3460672.1 pyrroloquinoline quinone biosynthesis protein PqqE [Sulfitobacter sp. S74]MDF3464626.1 pyrroloquinoline quinone biosynthesis p
MTARPTVPAPIAMLAELTYRCPLSCPYCSNPVEMAKKEAELDTEAWADVFAQAARLGVLQLHLSGGEPASRRDLVALVAAARTAGLYTNLITSAIGLTQRRLKELETAGLDHVQLSLQGTDADMADRIGGYKGGFDRKMQAAHWIVEAGFPLTLNAVVHRQNLHQLPQAIEMAVAMKARRMEVAIVQFHGWAMLNRKTLMPTAEQATEASRIVQEARSRLKGTLVIDYVPADYHSDYPKRCMGGWGTTGLNVTPDGLVLPCHAAQTIPTLEFDNVRDKPLADIWYNGTAFNAYRGEDWMQEPCKSCDRRKLDFGGCRCQAMAIAGQAAATDPVCVKSPVHGKMVELAQAFSQDETGELVYRKSP